MTLISRLSNFAMGAVVLAGFGIEMMEVRLQSQGALPPPILEYLFEEGAGYTVFNTGTFTGADGTLHEGLAIGGGPTFSTDTAPGGTSHYSLAFDGSNDFVLIPDQFDYTVDGHSGSTPLDQLTIEAWIKPATLAGQRVIWDDYGNPGLLFAVFDGYAQFSLSTASNPGPGISLFVPGVLVANQWQHIAGVYDGNKMRIFVNGQDTCRFVSTSGAIQDNSTVNPGSAPIAIGADSVTIPALNFQGLIDDVRIYPVALNRSQLAGGTFANVPAASCAIPAIQALIAKVLALNLQKGISNSLDAKIEAALLVLDDINQHNDAAAINTLQAFVSEVQTQQANGRISSGDATALIAAAQDIIAMLAG